MSTISRIGISITKSTSFRNGVQEFSNVYYFENAAGPPDQAQADTLIDQLAAAEKTVHSSAVTFVRGRLWLQTGDKATTNMISQKNLSGTGARATAGSMDKERAFLLRIRAGNDSRGQPVYLRKWFHACGTFYSGQTITTAQLENTNGFSAGEKTSIANQMAPITNLTGSNGPWAIVAKSGRTPSSGASWESHNFLEHHQLGDMWRAQ